MNRETAKTPPHSRLKLGQLRLIAAIEDSGSVSAAAQALNVSQPAASRQIGELEALFGAHCASGWRAACG